MGFFKTFVVTSIIIIMFGVGAIKSKVNQLIEVQKDILRESIEEKQNSIKLLKLKLKENENENESNN